MKNPTFVAFAFFLLCQVAQAQLPATRLGSVFPAGASLGKSVEVTITGTDLDDVDQIVFSHPGITAKQKTSEPGPFDKGPQPVVNQFLVTVAANVPVGQYESRAVGKYGASNPRAFCVSDLSEINETEPNNDREQATEFVLPAFINGQSNQVADVDYFRFTAAAGQRIIVTGFARRIDSRLDTVVSIFDANGRQLGGSGDDEGLDSLVDFTTPAAGQYLIKVHDSAYQGGPENVYRLSVGVLPHVDFVFPPAGVAGGDRPFTVYGRNLPGGQPAGLTIDGRPLEKLNVSIPLPAAAAQDLAIGMRMEPASAAVDGVEYRLKGPQGSSAPVLIGIASSTPVLETEPNNTPAQAQKLTLPCEVMGQFSPQRDRDWFQFDAKKGEAFSLEVISQRMGLRTSPSLLVERMIKPAADGQPEQTQQLAYIFESLSPDGGSEFDIQHNDPQYRFTAPEAGTFRVLVRDSFGEVTADPRRSYRLAISTGQPDFRLAAVPVESFASVLLRKGGQAGIRVVAFRRGGFDGEIQVTATGLPAGVTCSDAVIGPASNMAILTLTAAPNAAPATGLIQLVGKSRIGAAEVSRTARFGSALLPTAARADVNVIPAAVEGRLTRDLAVSISSTETGLVTFQAGGGKVWEASRAAQLKIPVARTGAFVGQLNYVPRGLPPGVTSPAANLAANAAAGEFQVNLSAATPPGTYSFYLDGLALQADYVRNPEAAAAAAARQKEVDQIKAQADAEAKTAADAKATSDKLVADTTAAVTVATTAKTTADTVLTAAQTAATAAVQQAVQTKAAATAQPNDANLATAATNAQKAADDAAAKVKTEIANVATAQKNLEDATVKAKTAADTKVVAEKKSTEAAQRAQLAAQLKTQTDLLATNLANAAKPQKRNIPIVSTPITLKITPAPITLTEVKASGPIKKAEKLEVPFTISRLYDYPGPVTFNTVIPPTAVGLSIPDVAIPAGQTQAKLTITAAPTAAPGEHELLLRATLSLNGQNLTVEQPLRVVVQ